MAKVYISSTFLDLKEERLAAAEALRALQHQPIAMEDYVAEDSKPLDKCLEDVRDCDLFVGIYAWRYGFVPAKQEKSITHLEYEEASKIELPRFIFLLDEGIEWPHYKKDPKPDSIRDLRQTLMNRHTISSFRNCDHLNSRVTASLAKWGNKTKAPIPEFLPYLTDRSDQEHALEDQFNPDLKRIKPRRPFVCILHGDENECHDAFIQRLQTKTLPTLLGLDREKFPARVYPLAWRDKFANVEDGLAGIRQNLAQKLTGDRRATDKAMKEEIDRHEEPVLIVSHHHATGWGERQPELIRKWIEYWGGWDDLIPERNLTILHSFEYKHPEPPSFARRLLSLFTSAGFEKTNSAMREFVRSLNFKAYDLHGVVLPELEAVPLGQAHDWARIEAARYFHSQKLIDAISGVYGRAGLVEMQMRRLAEELETLMSNARYRKEA
ncbi:MAG TPA: DUF4062 domain-containing protein [Pyrinomonadaceae bacterium]|nr:DUF4062 domain-containing protein [Pyrinomonadaceae bacterium]